MEDLQLHTNSYSLVPPPLLPYFSLWLSKALPLQNPELKLQGWALPSQPPQLPLSYSHLRTPPPGFPGMGRLWGTSHILGVLQTTPAELPQLLQPARLLLFLHFPAGSWFSSPTSPPRRGDAPSPRWQRLCFT